MTLIKKLTKNCCISLIQREDLQTKIGLNFLTQSLPGPNFFLQIEHTRSLRIFQAFANSFQTRCTIAHGNKLI